MRAVIQRVKSASVKVEGTLVSEIGAGVLIFLGVAREDTATEIAYVANKVANLRIFEDAEGKMNRSLLETGGAALVVSQFTLYGDCRKGRRPSLSKLRGRNPQTRFTSSSSPPSKHRRYRRKAAPFKR